MDTGHAAKSDGPAAAVSHYDNTGTAVADVAAGEDDHGIWVAGAMRPGVSEQQMYNLKATGALSGDWRRIGGNLELVAALAVNVPGFPIPRVEMAASAGRTMSLVAAAVVAVDPNALSVEKVAIAVNRALDERDALKARAARADALYAEVARCGPPPSPRRYGDAVTNITDEGAYRGATETKLVDNHDRGFRDYYTAGDSTPAAPTLTSIAPTTGTSATGATVTCTGTGFRTGCVVRQGSTNLATTFVSATSVTAAEVGKGLAAGTVQITVRNPDGDTTVTKPFVVT